MEMEVSGANQGRKPALTVTLPEVLVKTRRNETVSPLLRMPH